MRKNGRNRQQSEWKQSISRISSINGTGWGGGVNEKRLEWRRSAWPGRIYSGIQSAAAANAAAAIINTAPYNTVCDWRMPTGRPVGREKHSFVFASSYSIIYGNVIEGYRCWHLSYTLDSPINCSDWIVCIDM